jgi:hypothetical protein
MRVEPWRFTWIWRISWFFGCIGWGGSHGAWIFWKWGAVFIVKNTFLVIGVDPEVENLETTPENPRLRLTVALPFLLEWWILDSLLWISCRKGHVPSAIRRRKSESCEGASKSVTQWELWELNIWHMFPVYLDVGSNSVHGNVKEPGTSQFPMDYYWYLILWQWSYGITLYSNIHNDIIGIYSNPIPVTIFNWTEFHVLSVRVYHILSIIVHPKIGLFHPGSGIADMLARPLLW